MFKSFFFRRLLLPYLALICAVTIIIGLLGAVWLREAFIEQRRRDLRNTLALVSDHLSGPLLSGDAASLAQAVRAIGASLQCRVTVVAEDETGSVLCDNEAVPAEMGPHRFRPEISQAREAGEGWDIRTSGTLHEDLLYQARKLVLPDGKTVYVRLAVHMKQLRQSLHFFYWAIATAAAGCIAGASLISYRLAQRQAAPVLEVTRVADAIANGQLDHRILQTGRGELGMLARSLNRMADSFADLLASARSDQVELETILAGMSEGVLALDAQRRVRFANEAAGKMLHVEAAAVRGRPVWEVMRHPPLLDALDTIAAAPERKQLQLGPIEGRHIEITLCPLAHGARGLSSEALSGTAVSPPAGFIIVLHDITQSFRYQELRKEFVANVSHELRTPLTVIRGFIETLRDGAADDATRRDAYLATIDRHAQQLGNLVNDLLELSRLESQPGLGKQAPLDLPAVVQRAAEFLRPAAEKRRHQLHLQLPPQCPALMGNADYLERAVANLLDNAIKYTPEGGDITLRVTPAEGEVRIEVADTGVGIPPEDQRRIFERFYRVDRSRSRDMGGTGLGLAIVKHIVSAHGGSVEVSSQAGQGSTFTIRLPLSA